MTSDGPAGVRLAAAYTVTVGPDDVGARVVVRRRLADGQYGDVLGELESWSATVVVRDRHGVTHVIDRAEVVAAKRVPPPPERRR